MSQTTFQMTFFARLRPPLPGFERLGPKTYAAWPVWSDSTTKEVKFAPLPKKRAVKLWHEARRFERQTRLPGRQDGALGRNGLAVLHALVFDFLNFASGRLDPSYAAIAGKANISLRSVARGLQKLRAAGVLNWLRRCAEAWRDGRFSLEQDTNAYAVLPSTQWRGYRAEPAPQPPCPGTWGDHPPLPCLLDQVHELHQAGASMSSMLDRLGSDPGDGLAAALERLGRAMLGAGK